MFDWLGAASRHKTLTLREVDDAGLGTYIANLSNGDTVTDLAVLDLSSCRFDAVGKASRQRGANVLSALLERNATTLTALNFSRNELCANLQHPGLAFGAALSKLPRLHILDLSRNSLLGHGAAQQYRVFNALGAVIAAAGTLRRLCLAGNDLGPDAVGALAAWIGPGVRETLKYLDVSENPIGTRASVGGASWQRSTAPASPPSDGQLPPVAGAMLLLTNGDAPSPTRQRQQHQQREIRPNSHLRAKDSKIGSYGNASGGSSGNNGTIIWALRDNAAAATPLGALGRRQHGDADGLTPLCTVLLSCGALQVLLLRGCGLGDSDASAVAAVAAHSISLRVLDLSENFLSAVGASAVAAALRSAANLRDVRLSGNNIKDEGTAHLADAVPHALHLRRLDLRHNGLTTAARPALLAALTLCRAPLYAVDVGGNELAPEEERELRMYVRANVELDRMRREPSNYMLPGDVGLGRAPESGGIDGRQGRCGGGSNRGGGDGSGDGGSTSAQESAEASDFHEINLKKETAASGRRKSGYSSCPGDDLDNSAPLGHAAAVILRAALLTKLRQQPDAFPAGVWAALRGNACVMAAEPFRDLALEYCPPSKKEMLSVNSGALRKLAAVRRAGSSWMSFSKHRSAVRSGLKGTGGSQMAGGGAFGDGFGGGGGGSGSGFGGFDSGGDDRSGTNDGGGSAAGGGVSWSGGGSGTRKATATETRRRLSGAEDWGEDAIVVDSSEALNF